MRYTTFGHSGLRVSELAFGLMRLSDVAVARPMLDLYAEAAGKLGADRDRFVVATKYSSSAPRTTSIRPATSARTSSTRSTRRSSGCGPTT